MRHLIILFILQIATCLHLFAAAEETYLVSQSQNLKKIYECKDSCFKLNVTFPYLMKYNRIVWTQQFGNRVYMQGHCYVTIDPDQTDPKWIAWKDMPTSQLVKTRLQDKQWGNFNKVCENNVAELSEVLRKYLGLTTIHSQYQFYSDGRFVNTQEGKNGDINDLLNRIINSGIKLGP